MFRGNSGCNSFGLGLGIWVQWAHQRFEYCLVELRRDSADVTTVSNGRTAPSFGSWRYYVSTRGKSNGNDPGLFEYPQ